MSFFGHSFCFYFLLLKGGGKLGFIYLFIYNSFLFLRGGGWGCGFYFFIFLKNIEEGKWSVRFFG
jgi:hypothetical protein